MTLLILVLSEIIPKTIGASYWRQLALPSAAVIRILIFITYPLVIISEYITKLFSPKNPPASVSREEVSAMIDVGEEEGVFQAKESKAIQSVLHLSNVTARRIMTPKIVAEIVPADSACVDIFEDKRFTKSRIPVYDPINGDDFILGYILRSDLLEKMSEDDFGSVVSDLMRPILKFSETEPVSGIWEQMLQSKEHISVIVDEYGCFRGIVSMEDVIETMLGVEIVDEHDMVEDMQEYARDKAITLSSEPKS